jgi:hypothetical protein
MPGSTIQEIPEDNGFPKSDGFDPMYGPQLPRVKRTRRFLKFDKNDKATQGYWFTWAPDDRYESPISLGKYDLPRLTLITDTVRNKNFQGDRSILSDDGGEFVLRQSWWNRGSVNFYGLNPSGYVVYFYEGDLALNWVARHFDGSSPGDLPPQSDVDDIVGFGASAWNKFKPAKPVFSAAVAIAELREFPRLLHAKVEGLKSISDFHLAVQFGWKPLLSDITRMLNVYEKASSRLAFLQANLGKPVRRKGTVFYDAESGHLEHPGEIQMWNIGQGGYNDLPYNEAAWMSTERWKMTRRIWYSAEYVFYDSDISMPETRSHSLAALLGVIPTPADVWAILPWSWLIDWFSNAGDLLENLTDQIVDRQVTKYAYIMGETTRQYEQTTTEGNAHPSRSRNYVTKVRKKVDPYGASVGGDLTLLQLSILAALGISRS